MFQVGEDLHHPWGEMEENTHVLSNSDEIANYPKFQQNPTWHTLSKMLSLDYIFFLENSASWSAALASGSGYCLTKAIANVVYYVQTLSTSSCRWGQFTTQGLDTKQCIYDRLLYNLTFHLPSG